MTPPAITIFNVCKLLVNIKLLSGICTQNCNTCQPQQQQPTYIAPQQLYFQAPLQRILYGPTGAFYSAGNSVVVTVPVATMNRANPQQIGRTSGCCTPVASQPAWGQPQWPAQRTQPNYLVQAGNDNRPTTGVNYQNAIYTQATPRPVVNYTPGQGYQQQQPGAQGQAGNVQAPNYNGVNQPSGGPNNNGEYTSTYEGTFFGPANQLQNTQGGQYAPLPYNEENLGGQGQGQYQQGQQGQQGVAGAAAAGVLYPAAGELGNQGYQGGNQGYPQGQMNTGEANYQGGPAQQGNYQGNYQQANEQYPTQGPNQQGYQDQGQQGQPGQQGQQGQQQQGFPYSTTNPNEGWAPTEAPTMSTAGYTPGPGDYTYSTTYNPNNQYQGGSTPMPDNGNVYVSPLYDGQGTQQGFQSTTPYPGSSQGYGVGGAVAAGAVAGAAAGAAAAGAAGRTTTPSPYGQTADGQFVDQQYASTTPYPSNQQGYSSTMLPSTSQGQQYTGQPQNDQGFTGQGQGQQGQYASSTPGFTGQTQGQQGQYTSSTPGYGYTGQGQGEQGQYDSSTPGYDGAPTTNMNYQYSQGVGADGQTVTPFMGSSTQQPFAQTQNDFGGQQRDQSTTLSPQAQGSVNGRLYDHGDMNAVYGRYNNGTEITDSSSPAGIQRDQQADDQTTQTQSTAATSSLLAAVLALIYVFTF